MAFGRTMIETLIWEQLLLFRSSRQQAGATLPQDKMTQGSVIGKLGKPAQVSWIYDPMTFGLPN